MADGPTRDANEAADRLRAALAMFETGVEMKRQTLRRENPGLTELETEARLRAWLGERPGAEFGDTVGRRVPWPRPSA
jgi:Rv0078B-related antitoxin